MKIKDILRLRLFNQQISENTLKTAGELVSWLGAIQAQDYAGAKWSIGLRVKNLNETGVEKAIENRTIVRTWPMRGTLHFVAAEDVRWMLRLLIPRIMAGMAGRNRQLELDDAVFNKSQDLLLKAMEGGKQLMRSEVYAILEENKIATTGQRGIHIINYLAQKQVLCHGLHNEKQATYVLLDDWIPESKKLEEEEALAEIALRYFKSHGPATIQDFAWWTGLKLSDARKGIAANARALSEKEVEGHIFLFPAGLPDNRPARSVHLLPGFDEYMLGYTNRVLMTGEENLSRIVPGNNGMFMPTIVVDGKVKGLWKRTVKKDKVHIELLPFETLNKETLQRINTAANRYSKYTSKEIKLHEPQS